MLGRNLENKFGLARPHKIFRSFSKACEELEKDHSVVATGVTYIEPRQSLPYVQYMCLIKVG